MQQAPPVVFRGFSGHWMAFYSAAAAILYSTWVVSKQDPADRCRNGHWALPTASYCEACGAQLVRADLLPNGAGAYCGGRRGA